MLRHPIALPWTQQSPQNHPEVTLKETVPLQTVPARPLRWTGRAGSSEEIRGDLRTLWSRGFGMGWSRKEGWLQGTSYPRIPGRLPTFPLHPPPLPTAWDPSNHPNWAGKGMPSLAPLTLEFQSSQSCFNLVFSKEKNSAWLPGSCFFGGRLKGITSRNEIRDGWSKAGKHISIPLYVMCPVPLSKFIFLLGFCVPQRDLGGSASISLTPCNSSG